MSTHFRTFVVVNPHSANKKTERHWSQIARHIGFSVGKFEHEFTSGPGDATRIARQALRAGAEMVVSVGGDGTHNEVINGFFGEDGTPINPDAVLGIISRGTGADFIKTMNLPKDFELAALALTGKGTRTVDVVRTSFHSRTGDPVTRYFLNITDFGVGGYVVDAVNNTSKALGGRLSFAIGSVRGILSYENQPMRVELDDGEEVIEGRFQNVIAANGRYFGGGMKIAPKAEPDDGLMDVIFMGDLSRREMILLSPRVYKGEAEKHPKIFSRRARKLLATSAEEVRIDMDGEGVGKLPIQMEIVPQAIRVKVP